MYNTNDDYNRGVSVIKLSENTSNGKDLKNQNGVEKDINPAILFKSSLLYQIKEFFNNSTLHGVRYIAETGRPFIEKFMWFCFTTIGAIAALVIIFSLWEKFQTNPTITGLDTDFHNQRIIFPIVMVCPHVAYDSEKVKTVAYSKVAMSAEDGDKFIPFLEELPKMSYSTLESLNVLIDEIKPEWEQLSQPLRNYIFDVVIDCENVFDKCRYKGEDIACCRYFFPVFVEHGYCFAFNTRYIDKADSEYSNSEINYLFETDKKWQLYVKLVNNSNVYLHDNVESPGIDYEHLFVWNTYDSVNVLLSMSQTYTTEDTRQLSVAQRKCIFPDERKLKYYNEDYTFTGCMRDCRIDNVLKFCKCAPPFYKPSPLYKHCELKDFGCLNQFKSNITSLRSCRHCELSCHNTVYEIEKLNVVLVRPTEEIEQMILIEYLTWPIVRYKREVLFGWVDLLVSFGGIAGLFLGFSLLSGVEIIYYFTMRACCMFYKNRKELYKIEHEKRLKPLDQYDLSLKPDYRKRSASTPPAIKIGESTDDNDQQSIVRAGTRFLRADRLNHNKKSRAWDDRKSFFRPSFKLGAITPMEMHTNPQFRSSSVDKLAFMP